MGEFPNPRIERFHMDIVAGIPCDPDTVEVRSELATMRTKELVTVYLNWMDRRIAPRKRQVRYVDGFWKHAKVAIHMAKILEIERTVCDGGNLSRHLSTRVDPGFVSQRVKNEKRHRLGRWADKDLALNAYDVHHLHLGGDDLLFVMFSREVALFFMLGAHHSFDDGSLLRAVGEWREKEDRFVLKGILPEKPFYECEQERVDDDRQHQRTARNGFATSVSVGGKAVIGAQITMAGTSIWTTLHAGQIIRTIWRTDPLVDDPKWTAEQFNRCSRPVPPAPNYFWGFRHCDLILYESTSRTAFHKLDWRR